MKQILYFDDERWQAEPLVKNLQTSRKYYIKLVSTIKDFFLELESRNTYDLFILDVMIPMDLFDEKNLNKLSGSQRRDLNNGLDTGIVLFKLIRQSEKYKTVPVLFYTAKKSVSVNDQNIKFISKPEFPTNIETEINKLLTLK